MRLKIDKILLLIYYNTMSKIPAGRVVAIPTDRKGAPA